MNELTRNELHKETERIRGFYETYLRGKDYCIVSKENPDLPYDKKSSGTPFIRWGGNFYLPQMTTQNAERLPNVVAQVREEIRELGFVLEENEGHPHFPPQRTFRNG